MKFVVLLSILLFSVRGYTKGMLVEFSCADNGPSKVINVYFDEKSDIVFDPDVTKNSSLICLNKFQSKVREGVFAFRSKHCPSSKDPICNVSADFTNSKVTEKINSISNPKPSTSSTSTSSPQRVVESRIASPQFNSKSLNETFRHEGRDYKVSDFDDVIGNNIENIFMKMSRDEAKQFTQNYLVTKTSLLNSRSPAKAQVLSNLEKMYGYVYGEKGDAELAKAIAECAPPDNITTIADVLNQVSKSEKISKCNPLKPGEHKVFEMDWNDQYGTGNYLLRRTPEGNYQAILNVKFKPGAGSVTPAAMMDRAKACLNHASQFIKGPNGERLQMAVLSPDEIQKLPSNQRPQQREISIESAEHRSNSGAYSQDVDCATITHEMLHLMGLCDEYQETDATMTGAWGCRVVTKAPSIMRSHTQAYAEVAGNASICNCSSATCQTIMKSGNENLKKIYQAESIYQVIDYKFRNEFCMEYVGSYKSMNPDKKASVISDKGNDFIIENNVVEVSQVSPYYKTSVSQFKCKCPPNRADCLSEKSKIFRDVANIGQSGTCSSAGMSFVKSGVSILPETIQFPQLLMRSTPKSNGSLLHPNQFKKILAGNCPGIVDGYLECASWAYKGPSNTTCNVPARCNDDSHYLGTPQ